MIEQSSETTGTTYEDQVMAKLKGYEYLCKTAGTPGYWGKGDTIEEAKRNCVRSGGRTYMGRRGYIVYLCHPATRVDELDGGLFYPEGEQPLVVESKLRSRRSKHE